MSTNNSSDGIDLTFVDEVIIFDVDEGTLKTLGEVNVFDLVGDSGTVLRQASEGIAQLKNKMGKSIASLVKGSKEIDSSSQRELVIGKKHH